MVDEERPIDGSATGCPSGVWSWNVALAAQRLSEAESAFQSLVAPKDDGEDVVVAIDDNNGNNDVFQDNENSSNNDTKSNNNKEHLYVPPRKNRFIAPDKRPRNTRREYRLSPLEPIDDEKLIPSLKMEDIAAAIPAAIQRERLFEQHPLPLLLGKRLWCYNGLDYEEEHPMAGYGGGANDVTPDDWPEDNVDDDDDGDEGVGNKNKPWPRGTPYDASVFTLCWNYFLFTYGKATTASNKVIFWEIIASFIPPACSYLFGTGLIDELNDKTSRGQTDQERIVLSSLYAIAILALRTFGNYLTTQPNHCGYSVNGAPNGAARAGLRDTLFHRMRHLKSPLKDKITPGGASGIIVDKVFETVNIYYAFLTFPSLVSGILAEFVVSFTSLRNIQFTGVVVLPMVAVIVLSILLPVLINMWYQPELCILTRLEHQWRLRLRAVAGGAIPVHGDSFVYNDSTMNEGNNNNNCADKEGKNTDEEEECFRKIFHQCVYLENMRHFHSWKMSVVISFLIGCLTQTGIGIVTIAGAYAVITGRGVTVGNFATLISSVSGVIRLGSEMGSFFIGLYENHTMLKQISCIINDEDIGFDGGADPFGSIKASIVKKEKEAAAKLKNALHHNHHRHDDTIELDATKSDVDWSKSSQSV